MNKFIALSIILLASLTGCKKDEPESLVINPCGLDFSTTISYAAIGDEFSAGLYLADGEAWPNIVANHVDNLGFDIRQFIFVGVNGNTTADVLTAWNTGGVKNCKNLATVMVGTHDLLQGRSAQQFKADYSQLISTIKTTVTDLNHITCVTLPDYSNAPGLPSSAGSPAEVLQRIQAYNAAILDVASTQGINSADIFEASQVSYNYTLAEEDEFHPDQDQHQLWGNSISFAVENGLEE